MQRLSEPAALVFWRISQRYHQAKRSSMAKIQLETFLPVVAQVAGLIATTARSTASMNSAPAYLDLLAAIVGAGTSTYARLVELKALVQQMVLEDREPTNDEWVAMFKRSNDAHAAIQNTVIEDDNASAP